MRDSGCDPATAVEDIEELDGTEARRPGEGSHPRRYLPPPGIRPRQHEQAETPLEPENKLARRAKLFALLIAIALLAAAVVAAASMASDDARDGGAAHSAASKISPRTGQPF